MSTQLCTRRALAAHRNSHSLRTAALWGRRSSPFYGWGHRGAEQWRNSQSLSIWEQSIRFNPHCPYRRAKGFSIIMPVNKLNAAPRHFVCAWTWPLSYGCRVFSFYFIYLFIFGFLLCFLGCDFSVCFLE